MLKKNIKNLFISLCLEEKLIINFVLIKGIENLEIENLNENLENLKQERENLKQEFENLKQDIANVEELNKIITPESANVEELNKIITPESANVEELNKIITPESAKLEELNSSIEQLKIKLEELDTAIQQETIKVEESTKILKNKLRNVMHYTSLSTELLLKYKTELYESKVIENVEKFWKSDTILNKDFLDLEKELNVEQMLKIFLKNFNKTFKSDFINVDKLICTDLFYLVSYFFEDRFNLYNLFNKVKPNILRRRRRKIRLNLRKLRKFRIFRIFKRIIKRKRYKLKTKFTNFYLNINNIKFVTREFKILTQKIMLTPRLLQNSNLFFFYRLNAKHYEKFEEFSQNLSKYSTNLFSQKKFKIFLRNFQRKPYQKLRVARLTHWGLFFKKTIRSNRYKNFVSRYFNAPRYRSKNLAFLFNFFTDCKISLSKTTNLNKLLKSFLVVQLAKKIYSLPLIYRNYINWKLFKKKNYIKRKKIGKWSYLNFKRSQKPWLQRKKNFPKLVNKLYSKFFFLKQSFYLDTFTNYLYSTTNLLEIFAPMTEGAKENFFIKLHMFRYKANKICIQHFDFIIWEM